MLIELTGRKILHTYHGRISTGCLQTDKYCTWRKIYRSQKILNKATCWNKVTQIALWKYLLSSKNMVGYRTALIGSQNKQYWPLERDFQVAYNSGVTLCVPSALVQHRMLNALCLICVILIGRVLDRKHFLYSEVSLATYSCSGSKRSWWNLSQNLNWRLVLLLVSLFLVPSFLRHLLAIFPRRHRELVQVKLTKNSL